MSKDQNEEIDWKKVMEKEAMGENGLDLGTIKQVEDDYIVSEMGGLARKQYNLPKSMAKSFNGVFLNFSINETNLSNYETRLDSIEFNSDSLAQSPESVAPPPNPTTTPRTDESLIPLVGEELDVTKRFTEDSLKLIKEPLKEIKTIQVELINEKITIERRGTDSDINGTSFNSTTESSSTNSASKSNSTDYKEPDYSKTEISIPVKREEPVITKRSFVREEIVVKKKPVTEIKKITKEVTNEEVEYSNTTS